MNMVLADLQKAATQFPIPKQYFAGMTRYTAELPENILFFCKEEEETGNRRVQTHYRHVLLFALEGAGSVIINAERFLFDPGQMVYITPYQQHLTICRSQRIWMYITFEMPECSDFQVFANRPVSLSHTVLSLLKELLQCQVLENNENKFLAMDAALKILQLLNQCAAEFAASDTLQRTPTVQKSLIDRINRYLFENIEEDFNPEEMAEKFGYSLSQLRRIYLKFMGINLGEYHRELRHAHAQTLLRQGVASINEIAHRCGYSSCYAFANAFKRREKCTPGEFRKKFYPKF